MLVKELDKESVESGKQMAKVWDRHQRKDLLNNNKVVMICIANKFMKQFN